MKILYYGAIVPTIIYSDEYINEISYNDSLVSKDEIKRFLEKECFTDKIIPRVDHSFHNNISESIPIINYIPCAYSIQIPCDNFGMSLYEDFGDTRHRDEIYQNIGHPINVVYYVKCVIIESNSGKEINRFKLINPTLYDKMHVEEV